MSKPEAPNGEAGSVPWLRVGLVAGFVLYIWGAPAYEQLFDRNSPYTHPWKMYSRVGSDGCRVVYLKRDGDGETTRIDRFAAMGFETAQLAPRSVRVLTSGKQIRSIGKKLCGEHEGSPITARYQCARRGRFGKVRETKNLCARGGRKGKKKKRAKASSLQNEFRRSAAK